MSQPTTKQVFVVNGEQTATIGTDGKLEPTKAAKVRADQVDRRAELGKQAWIDATYSSPDTMNSSL